MSYEEFLSQIGRAGLTVRQFAELVKMNRISLSNYAKKGEVPSHLALIAVLIAAMREQKIDFKAVISEIEIEPKKPRGAGIGRFGGDKQVDLF